MVVNHVNIDEDNIVLYSYDVFATDKKYKEKGEEKIKYMVDKFKERQSVLLVKTRGEEKVSRLDSFIWKQDMSVPNLNIEYYVIKNIDFFNNSVPVDTFIPLVFYYNYKINYFVYIIKYILFILLFNLFSFKYIYYIDEYNVKKTTKFNRNLK